MRSRDRFADDCLHRQKPAEICENLLGSKIYPRPDCTVGGKKARRDEAWKEAHNPMSGGSSRHVSDPSGGDGGPAVRRPTIAPVGTICI